MTDNSETPAELEPWERQTGESLREAAGVMPEDNPEMARRKLGDRITGFELMSASDYDLDLPRIAHLWNQGSVVRSWLLELAARALAEDRDLSALAGPPREIPLGKISKPVAAAPEGSTIAIGTEINMVNRLAAELRRFGTGFVVENRMRPCEPTISFHSSSRSAASGRRSARRRHC